ncbi:hypothetical protein Y032_0393g595 [Ancylostoma ceylanicum]|uniref:Uncharacterized protein n=1 Tax=Ancylostoma ceylanicum TaxID=53326 RepID=A0A016RRR6_9BILA|nr:hypothetical protein Y032_0393g595 [Ancylostoma ceylanicum]
MYRIFFLSTPQLLCVHTHNLRGSYLLFTCYNPSKIGLRNKMDAVFVFTISINPNMKVLCEEILGNLGN